MLHLNNTGKMRLKGTMCYRTGCPLEFRLYMAQKKVLNYSKHWKHLHLLHSDKNLKENYLLISYYSPVQNS
jgi:hypothetical protein